jgi:hypothetical protein
VLLRQVKCCAKSSTSTLYRFKKAFKTYRINAKIEIA